MLRRFLLVILMACLAAPAVAMPGHCGDTPAMQHQTGHHDQKDVPGQGASKHDCIGCIAPYLVPPGAAQGDAITAMTGKTSPRVLNTGPALQPDPPPPRA